MVQTGPGGGGVSATAANPYDKILLCTKNCCVLTKVLIIDMECEIGTQRVMTVSCKDRKIRQYPPPQDSHSLKPWAHQRRYMQHSSCSTRDYGGEHCQGPAPVVTSTCICVLGATFSGSGPPEVPLSPVLPPRMSWISFAGSALSAANPLDVLRTKTLLLC